MEKKHFPINDTRLLKHLFKTKQKLSDKNPLKDCVPFYWYRYGPYSPVILKIKEKMVKEGKIWNYRDGFVAAPGRVLNHSDHPCMLEARQTIDEIISESSSSNVQTAMYDIYQDYAPSKFYISFRNKFHTALTSYINDPSTRYSPRLLLELLEKSFGDIPNYTLFRDFKYLMRDLIEISSYLLKNNIFRKHAEEIDLIAESMFNLFAMGMRIKFHDEFYEPSVENWTKDYKEAVKRVESDIDRFALSSNNKQDKSPFVTFDGLIANILDLKSKNKLVRASFLPFSNNDEMDGSIDAELFETKTEEEILQLVQNFRNSRNAVIKYFGNKDIESENFKLITA